MGTNIPFLITIAIKGFINFAMLKQTRVKEQQIGIPVELYDDEAVCYIAGRYHTETRKVLQRFFVQEGIISEAEADDGAFSLEANEMEILRGLISANT